MENIIAENLIDAKYKDFNELDSGNIWTNIENLMIEFAKLKCKEMQEAILNNANLYLNPDNNEWEVENDSIRNAYDINSIK